MTPRETSCDAPEMHLLFMDVVAKETARLRRHGGRLSLVYVGLDDLGQVNLEHGRSTGDRALGAAAAALSSNCREEDYFWRRGEDEFVIVLTETGSQGAVIFAKRLASEIYSATDYAAVPVSASLGCSTYPDHGENAQDLYVSARAAMYLAKAEGKGIVQVAQAEHISDGPQERARPSLAAHRHGEVTRVQHENVRNLAPRQEAERFTVVERAIRVIITSPSQLLLSGMRRTLEGAAGIEIVDEVTDPNLLPLAVGELLPDIVFADLKMAVANDFATLRMVEAQNLPCRLAVTLAAVDQEAVRLAADFPVGGVFLQSESPEDVLAKLREIHQGQTVLPPEIQLALGELKSQRSALNRLSERELEILRLAAEGKPNSQIASTLFITVNTVRFHLANIFQKLGVSNRTEAANYYLRQNLGAVERLKLM